MVVRGILIENVRCHDRFSSPLSPKVTVITGKNGSGKTSILEAIHIGLRGTSFKGSDSEVLKKESPWWKVELDDDNGKRLITFDPSLDSGRKKITIDSKLSNRMSPKYKYPVVVFEPEDLRLLHGSPTRRRRFIDRFISQLDPLYSHTLARYERALKQRNNLLKKNIEVNDEQMFVWNVALAEHGSYIIEKRVAFVEKINNRLNEIYNQIAKSSDVVSMHYSHTYIGSIKQKLLNDLHNHLEKDRALGFTSVGPHRHDVIFKFNDSPALQVASRGEVRTAVLALKFIEVEVIEELTNQKPIVLLDDVFSELDESRQKYLIDGRLHQTILTSTHVNKLFINSDYLQIKL